MKTVIWVLFSIVVIVLLFAIGKGCKHASEQVDSAIVNYEDFQTIYNSCQKVNTDLCNMKNLPEKDKMFEQFSKAQRVNALQTKLNQLVEEYNGKSKMFNRSIWKSKDLPYQLDVNQFSCY